MSRAHVVERDGRFVCDRCGAEVLAPARDYDRVLTGEVFVLLSKEARLIGTSFGLAGECPVRITSIAGIDTAYYYIPERRDAAYVRYIRCICRCRRAIHIMASDIATVLDRILCMPDLVAGMLHGSQKPGIRALKVHLSHRQNQTGTAFDQFEQIHGLTRIEERDTMSP